MAISLSMSSDADFDDIVHNAQPSGAGVRLATKRGATSGGLPAVAIGFEAEVDGRVVRVQNVVTLRELVTAVRGLAVHHDTFDPAWQAGDTPTL